MNSYVFDLLEGARQATLGKDDKLDAYGLLAKRPFQLFYASDAQEAKDYVAGEPLRDAVNVSLATGRPLLLTGEPGTGKTSAANWIAGAFGLQSMRFQVKSNSRAQDLLYTFDAVAYFRESQMAVAAKREAPLKGQFVGEGPLWLALKAADGGPRLLLIDEIDKAPRDFPNDLLHELDRMEIHCPERNEVVKMSDPGMRPVVVITSNSERRLPEPFLRRCVYHNIILDQKALESIVERRLERTKDYFTADIDFRKAAEDCFFRMRAFDGLQKKPSVDEFWQWFVHVAQAPEEVRKVVLDTAAAGDSGKLSKLPFLATLVKYADDVARMP